MQGIESGVTLRSALLDFLERRPPRRLDGKAGAIVRSAETALDDVIETVGSLDNSCLVIQGPPGAGKSFTGAHIIAALVQNGKRVGVASNSHAAINNLLIGAARHCQAHGIESRFVCTKKTSEELDDLGISVSKNASLASLAVPGCVIGTTAWGFSRNDLADVFDVLIVDEAGQVAVANLVAMSRSAQNLVLMGDQRQLGQPTQGTHPAQSGLSVLDYRLGDTAAVDPEHGVFFGTTYRMHPAVNTAVSRYVYTDKLRTAEHTAKRVLHTSGDVSPLDRAAGIVFLPVEHAGNTQASDEEVDTVANAVKALLSRTLVRQDGDTRKVTMDDILFVAPYNAQVARSTLR